MSERARLLTKLYSDLLGPKGGPEETLSSAFDPRENYMTGVLIPRDTFDPEARINSDFDGLIEIDKDEFENKTIDSNESLTEVNNTLTDKYVVLEFYKGLAFLLMIVATGFFIYSLVQFFDAPKAAREILENAIITSTVSYFITMFSLFCLTKIIDFLFDLDKQDKILAPDKISSEEE